MSALRMIAAECCTVASGAPGREKTFDGSRSPKLLRFERDRTPPEASNDKESNDKEIIYSGGEQNRPIAGDVEESPDAPTTRTA